MCKWQEVSLSKLSFSFLSTVASGLLTRELKHYVDFLAAPFLKYLEVGKIYHDDRFWLKIKINWKYIVLYIS